MTDETLNTGLPMLLVSLKEITFETVRDIVALEVNVEQRAYVATNALSIAEAHFNPGAWLRAVYADDTPVGFLLMLDPTIPGALSRSPVAPDSLVLWRFMIDHRFQRKGYGKLALDLVCQHARKHRNAKRILSSYLEGPHGP